MLDPDSTALIIILILLVLHIYFAIVKEAVASVRRSRRLQLIEDGRSSAQIVDELAEDMPRLITTERLALIFLNSLIVVLATLTYLDNVSALLRQFVPAAEYAIAIDLAAILIITISSVLIILLLGELIPKEVGRTYDESIALTVVRPFNWASYLATPLARLVTRVGRILTGRWDEMEEDGASTTITEDDLRSYVDVGEEEGVLKEGEKEMIYSIFDLDDTMAREVMVPRIDIVAVEASASVSSALDSILQAGHSRVPVYVDTIDNIIGIIYVKDLLAHWLKRGEPESIQGLERKVYYVPETKPVSDLLRELQRKKVHIAIVVDEYGGTAGLVTIEDALEEIVGEIQDEHDADEFYMQIISEDEYIFSARMDLDDINGIMSLDLPTDESDTLGGLIYDMLGRIPKQGDSLSGDSVDSPQLRFTVLDVDGRRIKTVRVRRFREESQILDNQEAAADESSSTLLNSAQNRLSQSP